MDAAVGDGIINTSFNIKSPSWTLCWAAARDSGWSVSQLCHRERAILLVFCLDDMARLQAGEKGGIEHMGVPDINTEHALT